METCAAVRDLRGHPWQDSLSIADTPPAAAPIKAAQLVGSVTQQATRIYEAFNIWEGKPGECKKMIEDVRSIVVRGQVRFVKGFLVPVGLGQDAGSWKHVETIPDPEHAQFILEVMPQFCRKMTKKGNSGKLRTGGHGPCRGGGIEAPRQKHNT